MIFSLGAYLILLVLPFSTFAKEIHYPPNNFFPVEDVSSVVWAHGVNSQDALSEALANSDIRMLEADIRRGWLNESGVINPIQRPVMAHPPVNVSDLSFASFIDQVIAYNKDKPLDQMKGVKLDFKDYFAAAFSILAMRGRNDSSNGTALNFPIWVNADVVKGPVNSSSEPKIDGADLLQLHKINLPSAVLSLGWTTRFDPKTDNGQSYTRYQMDEMINAFRRFSYDPEETVNLPVTYAVRAAIAQNSMDNLLYLMNATSHRASITLWAGASDPEINMTLVADMFKLFGRNRVFVDLPYNIVEENAGFASTPQLLLVHLAFGFTAFLYNFL